MKYSINFDGLESIRKQLEKTCDPATRRFAEENALTRIGHRAKAVMYGKIPVSEDNSTSGRALKFGRESRPKHGHARDNIPVTRPYRRRDGSLNVDVGWLLGDNSEYFYMKFVEWGTFTKPPRDFLYSTLNEAGPELADITLEEYQRFIQELGIGD